MYAPRRIVLLLATMLALLAFGTTAALAAPRLLNNDNRQTFRVRAAIITLGMFATITGPNVTAQGLQRGRWGHIRWSRWTRNEARGRGRAWVRLHSRGYPANIRRPACAERALHPPVVVLHNRQTATPVMGEPDPRLPR